MSLLHIKLMEMDLHYNKSKDIEGDVIIRRAMMKLKIKKDQVHPETIKRKCKIEHLSCQVRKVQDVHNAMRYMAYSAGFDEISLTANTRLRNVVEARQCATWIIHFYAPCLSLNSIGALMGIDHSSIIYYLKKISARINGRIVDKRLKSILDGMLKELQSRGLITSKEYYFQRKYEPANYTKNQTT